MGRRIMVVIIAALATACGQAGDPGGSSSGIAGKVIAYPACPVFVETSPCPEKRVETSVSIEASDGEVVQVQTESDGTFRVDLAPGRYLLAARAPASDPHLVPRPATATVRAGRYARVTVILDTRLREP
jgi:Carboxypeptidase regulatory-like domain